MRVSGLMVPSEHFALVATTWLTVAIAEQAESDPEEWPDPESAQGAGRSDLALG